MYFFCFEWLLQLRGNNVTEVRLQCNRIAVMMLPRRGNKSFQLQLVDRYCVAS